MTDRDSGLWCRSLLLVAAVALVVYLPGFWWGVPHATAADRVLAWGVDDTAPLGPLAEIHNIIEPKPDRNLGYPLLHDFMAAAAYAPYLLALRATGGMHGVSAVYPFGLADPVTALRNLALINHLLTVLLGVAVVAAAFDIGRTLWGKRPGLLGALFAMTVYPMFYYARTGNVDVPMLAFVALAMAALARALAHGMTRARAVWFAVFAGCALATKEAAIGALLPGGVLMIVLGRRAGGWRTPLLALAAGFAALGIGSGLFVEPGRWIAHVRFISGRVQDVPGATTLTSAFPMTLAGHLSFAGAILTRLVEAMSLPGLLLGVVAAVVAAWRDRRAALFAISIPSYVVVEFLLLRSAQLRYVMPTAFLLAPFAGWAVATALGSARTVRATTLLAAAAALLIQIAHGASLTWEMLRDSRYEARTWIASRVVPGDRIDYFGASQKLPPLPEGVVTELATPWRGMWSEHRADSSVAREVLERWASSPPALIIIIPDHSSRPGLPYDASVPSSLYEGLLDGDAGPRLAAFFQTPPLIPGVSRPALDYPSVNPPIRIFEPAVPGDAAPATTHRLLP